MILKELLRKNGIKIKALAKDKVIFYTPKDAEKAQKVLESEYDTSIDSKNKNALVIAQKTNKASKTKKPIKEETTSADIGGASEPIAYKKKEKGELFRRLVNTKKGVKI